MPIVAEHFSKYVATQYLTCSHCSQTLWTWCIFRLPLLAYYTYPKCLLEPWYKKVWRFLRSLLCFNVILGFPKFQLFLPCDRSSGYIRETGTYTSFAPGYICLRICGVEMCSWNHLWRMFHCAECYHETQTKTNLLVAFTKLLHLPELFYAIRFLWNCLLHTLYQGLSLVYGHQADSVTSRDVAIAYSQHCVTPKRTRSLPRYL